MDKPCLEGMLYRLKFIEEWGYYDHGDGFEVLDAVHELREIVEREYRAVKEVERNEADKR